MKQTLYVGSKQQKRKNDVANGVIIETARVALGVTKFASWPHPVAVSQPAACGETARQQVYRH